MARTPYAAGIYRPPVGVFRTLAIAGNLTCSTLTCGSAQFTASINVPHIFGVTAIDAPTPPTATSAGASLTITAGSGGATSGSGGTLSLLGGGATNGLGGDVFGQAGSGGGAGTGNTRRGGNVTWQGGTGGPSANGGASILIGGNAGSTAGNAGAATVSGGVCSNPTGLGGQCRAFGGDNTVGGNGGELFFAGGDSNTPGQPGSVHIDAGAVIDTGLAGTATVVLGGQRSSPVVIDPMSWLRHGHTAGTVEGDVWEDSATHQIKFHNGTAVKTVTSS